MKIKGMVQGHTDFAWQTGAGKDVSGSNVCAHTYYTPWNFILRAGTVELRDFLSRKAKCQNCFLEGTP